MNRLSVIIALGLATVVFSCKKKEEQIPVTLTAKITYDSAFTTTNVRTDNQNNGIVYLTAKGGNDQEIKIMLSDFVEAKKTYLIDYRGTGGNITGNTLMYRKGSNAVMARGGSVRVTEVTNKTFTATYSSYFQGVDITGTFTAAIR